MKRFSHFRHEICHKRLPLPPNYLVMQIKQRYCLIISVPIKTYNCENEITNTRSPLSFTFRFARLCVGVRRMMALLIRIVLSFANPIVMKDLGQSHKTRLKYGLIFSVCRLGLLSACVEMGWGGGKWKAIKMNVNKRINNKYKSNKNCYLLEGEIIRELFSYIAKLSLTE